ncbi:MAG: PHP domain-containing protein [Firmicutes bacterium]|nr:PHP domain-containing protein [Bacillota bacterium]
MKRFFAAGLALLLALALSAPAFALEEKAYMVNNPYKDVVWDVWEPFKANLHTHTTFSDGTDSLAAMAEAYYAQGYEVIANTDHGVISKPWDQKPVTVFPLNVVNIGKPSDVLTSARMAEMNAGVGENRNGRKMIQVPLGIEMNAATVFKSHVVGLYGGWGYAWFGLSTDFRIPIAGTQRCGGVSVIAHPGDWIKSAGDADIARDPANVNFFADILRDYDSCLGMEAYNGGDSVTRHDRVLWDQLLMRLMPEGRHVWGFANDDSHNTRDIGRTAEILFMEKNTPEDVRNCIETGAFLACSHRDNPMNIDGDRTKPFPGITKVTVTPDAKSITLVANEYDTITWITDGEEVAGSGLTVDLTQAKVKSYVRAQLVNADGVTLTQPFGVDKGDGYRHPDDSLKGWEKVKWTLNLYLTKNVFGWIVVNIGKLFDK